MTAHLLTAVASFAAVFIKGIQHQNINAKRLGPILVTSYLITITDVFVVSVIVKDGWASVIPLGTGAALGIAGSVLTYDSLTRWFAWRRTDHAEQRNDT